eukprot:1576035-Pyramimonas_sp.AAC.1
MRPLCRSGLDEEVGGARDGLDIRVIEGGGRAPSGTRSVASSPVRLSPLGGRAKSESFRSWI